MIEICNCQVLVDKGAKLTTDHDGWTPLHSAASSSTHDSTVIQLLVGAVDPSLSGDSSPLEAKTSVGQNTALHLAAHNTKSPAPLRYENLCQVLIMCSGPDLLPAGLLFRKTWGPLIYEYPPSPRLPLPDTHSSHHRHFVEDPCCNAHYYCSSNCLAV